MKRRPPRNKEEILAAVAKAVHFIEDGSNIKDALERAHVSNSVWSAYRPKVLKGAAVKTRRTKDQVERDARRVHALVLKGVSIIEASKRIGLKEQVYRRAAKQLGLPPKGAMTGSVNADMLPPRPDKKGTGKGGYQRLSVPPDMNSVQSLAQRIGLIDKKLEAVKGFAKDRKTYAKRLMELLRKGA